METFQSLLTRELSRALAAADLPAMGDVVPATDARFGDYQTNAALVLAKQRGENPRALAQKIIEHLEVAEWCEPPTIAGAGFINFSLKPEAVAAKTMQLLQDDRLGVPRAETPHRIVIDFGSPNVAKPMHVGHIRSTVLGDALARIAKFLGHEVIRDNHIGDWGTQFGMVIYGWKNLLDRAALERDPIAELVRIYKTANELSKSDEAVRDACRNELVRLQAGDEENLRIWNECVALSKKEFEAAYEILDIHYDIQRGESFYNDRLPAVVDRLLKSGLGGRKRRRDLRFFPRYSRARRAAVHHSEKRRRFQLRHDRCRDGRLPDSRSRRRHGLDCDRRAATAPFPADLRDRAARRLHGGFPPHHPRQHPRRRPQADENALGRERAAARRAR